MPHDEPLRTDVLLEEVWRLRQATLMGLMLRLSESQPQLYKESDLAGSLESFLKLSPTQRRQLTEYPPFRIWLRQAADISATSSVNAVSGSFDKINKLKVFSRLVTEFDEVRKDTLNLGEMGRRICVTRFAVDPLIAEVAPPSYYFPNEERQRELEAGTAYHLSFFGDVLKVALDQIKNTWLSAFVDFTKFVRQIIHVTDAEFRSCSADRYAGIIFLSADDESLIDLEESLIHEYGHQILYNVMEIDPLFASAPARRFTLPWSGSERDFYGYFHAFYIYILLVHYFERVKGRPKKDQKKAFDRLSHILKGLIQALPELEAYDAYTPRGQQLFENLQRDIYELRARHKDAL